MKFRILILLLASAALFLSLALTSSGADKLAPRGMLRSDALCAITQSDSTPKNHSDSTLADSTSIGSHLTFHGMQELIRRHNEARASVGVPPVTWSKEIAIYAQDQTVEESRLGKINQIRNHFPLAFSIPSLYFLRRI